MVTALGSQESPPQVSQGETQDGLETQRSAPMASLSASRFLYSDASSPETVLTLAELHPFVPRQAQPVLGDGRRRAHECASQAERSQPTPHRPPDGAPTLQAIARLP